MSAIQANKEEVAKMMNAQAANKNVNKPNKGDGMFHLKAAVEHLVAHMNGFDSNMEFPAANKYEMEYESSNGIKRVKISNPIEESIESITVYKFGKGGGIRRYKKSNILSLKKSV